MFIRPNAGRITSPFDPARKNPVHGRVQPHTGVDFGRDGSPVVVAAADGIVTRARVMGGYGNCVTIKHTINGKTYETLYAHLKSFNVKVNQKVKVGAQIGVRGSTGNSTGEHLHFSIFSPYYKEGLEFALDPLHYIVDEDVKNLQTLLNKVGYKLTVDGLRGNATDTATRDFQKKNSLTPDGIAGTQTMRVLNAKAGSATPSNKPKGDEDELKFSSGTLKKEFEIFIESRAQREIIVKYAVSQGYSQKWITDVMQGKAEDGDLVMLGLGAIIRANK